MKKLFFTSAILLGGVTLAAAQDAKKAKAVIPNKTEQPAPAAPAARSAGSVKTSKSNSGISKQGGAAKAPASAQSLFEATSGKQN